MRPLKGEEISVIVLGMIIGMVGATLCIKLNSILKQKVEKVRIGESEFADAGTSHPHQLNFQDPLTGYMEGMLSLDQHFLVLKVLIVCLVGWLLSSTLVLYREKSLRKILVFFHASAHELDRPAVPKPRSLKKSVPCKSLNLHYNAASSKEGSSLKLTFKEVFETTRVPNKAHDSLNFSSKRG